MGLDAIITLHTSKVQSYILLPVRYSFRMQNSCRPMRIKLLNLTQRNGYTRSEFTGYQTEIKMGQCVTASDP